MTTMIREVMTPNPVTIGPERTISEAAELMRDHAIGDVIVSDDDGSAQIGVLTDRDIVVRVLAEGLDPHNTTAGQICSVNTVTVAPEDSIAEAIQRMRDAAVRRLPVVEGGGHVVGIVSLGDLAIERDEGSALADISAAEPNS
jgi:CBS domain-containing protein